MRKTEDNVSWVVYRISMKNVVGGVAICKQSEWEEMDLARPGYHTLIQGRIGSESEAEKLARSQPGVTPPPKVRGKPRS